MAGVDTDEGTMSKRKRAGRERTANSQMNEEGNAPKRFKRRHTGSEGINGTEGAIRSLGLNKRIKTKGKRSTAQAGASHDPAQNPNGPKFGSLENKLQGGTNAVASGDSKHLAPTTQQRAKVRGRAKKRRQQEPRAHQSSDVNDGSWQVLPPVGGLQLDLDPVLSFDEE